MRKVNNTYEQVKCNPVKIAQYDNIDRSSYQSAESLVNEFHRAGITRVEMLKRLYPESRLKDAITDEQIKNIDTSIMSNIKEDLDLQDRLNILNKRMKENKETLETLKQQTSMLEKNIAKKTEADSAETQQA